MVCTALLSTQGQRALEAGGRDPCFPRAVGVDCHTNFNPKPQKRPPRTKSSGLRSKHAQASTINVQRLKAPNAIPPEGDQPSKPETHSLHKRHFSSCTVTCCRLPLTVLMLYQYTTTWVHLRATLRPPCTRARARHAASHLPC